MSPRAVVAATDVITSLGDGLDATFANIVRMRTNFGLVNRFDVSGAVNGVAAVRKDAASPATLVHRLVARLTAEHGSVTVDRAYFAGSPDVAAPELPRDVRRSGAGCNLAADGWDRVYTGACVSSSSALMDAAWAIRHGTCRRALVVAARTIDPATFHVFSAGGAMTREDVPRPLTAAASGILLGEGAAMFLLEADDGSDDRAPVGVEVRGWGRAGDAFHPYQPEPTGRGMVRAIREALGVADLRTEDIDHVSLHGTASARTDTAEVAALNQVFGEGRVPPTQAPKSALGHLLEGSGLVEAAVAARAITASTLPPSLGIRPLDELLVDSVTRHPIHTPVRHVLTTNVGIGGGNTALVLSRCPDAADRSLGPPDPGRRPLLRRSAAVGPRSSPPPVRGFIGSSFPRAVHDAAVRCLDSADLCAEHRASTALLLLAPNGDAETRSAVYERLEQGRRLPPPFFVQSTPSSILGRIASDHGLFGAINVVATAAPLDARVVVDMAAEMAAADGSRLVLVIRHIPAGGLAEAALYVCGGT